MEFGGLYFVVIL